MLPGCLGPVTQRVPLLFVWHIRQQSSRHNLETHWLGFSISIVILARGHGSGSVDRQCSNSEVSSGDITGSSPPCER